MSDITAKELFDRVADILDTQESAPEQVSRKMHETLVLVCHEGTSGTNQAFGNLFAQVDFLCKRFRVRLPDTIAIQKMRRDSNAAMPLGAIETGYNLRALAVFIAAVFDTSIPPTLVGRLPVTPPPPHLPAAVDFRLIRCIVRDFDGQTITALVDQESGEQMIRIDYSDPRFDHLRTVLRNGCQLNLIDAHLADRQSEGLRFVVPSIIVYEPDFLIDISAIARCFTDYGHHPLAYTVNRLSPAATSQAILIGHLAGMALDDIIHTASDYHWEDTFRNSFRDKSLEYCACEDLNQKEDFKAAALRQTENIRQIVDALFASGSGYDRNKAILEPSFVCEQLGIQGRVDLMTTDMRLLVEQKSGANFSIECNRPNVFGSFQKEDHYVQLLLYYGVLRQNFHLPSNQVDIRLLYSKYPLPGGLVIVNFYQELFREAIRLRNLIVSHEFRFAQEGFGPFINRLSPEVLNEKRLTSAFFYRWIEPRLRAVTAPMQALQGTERAYFSRMMTFVYREQLTGKLGAQERTGNCSAYLWTMPLSEKRETGNIYTGLRIVSKTQSNGYNGYDTVTLSVPDQGEDFLPNFRIGDSIYLYAYDDRHCPDARAALLYRGTLTEIHSDRVTVHLNDGQQNPDLIAGDTFAIEHGASDAGFTLSVRSLHDFITAPKARRDLLLGCRQPQTDRSLRLTTSYHPDYDPILLKALQAQDYFLLVGPPGTGKTSMALQYMVREHLARTVRPDEGQLLLMAYTNRAVDEICGMLEDNGIDYLRLGNEYTCDTLYRHRLLDHATEGKHRLDEIRRFIHDQRIIVGTTSTLQSRSYIFRLKHFQTAIVDEASQILEPGLVGLLTQVDKFILIGDHKQLPAVVQQDASQSIVEEPELQAIGLTDCRNSLFERLIRQEQKARRTTHTGILRKQGRMHPDIAEFPNQAFYADEQLEPVPLPHQLGTHLRYDLPSLDALDELLKGHRMVFIPSRFNKRPDLSDKVNADEARIVCTLLQRIRRFYGDRFDPQKTVGVIVPYRNQIAMIRKEAERAGIPDLASISIDTVERYQGSQRDVIIYSFTVQNRYQLDFLTANSFEETGRIIDRKLNVAITRAREQLIMTGNAEVLSHNLIFRRLMAFVETRGGMADQG